MAKGDQRAHDLYKGFEDYYSFHGVLDGSGEAEIEFDFPAASVSVENASAADMWVVFGDADNEVIPTDDGTTDTTNKMVRVPVAGVRAMDKRTTVVRIAGAVAGAYHVIGLI